MPAGSDAHLQPATELAGATAGVDAAAGLAARPRLGPPPPGWSVWIAERANPRAWLYSFAAAAALYAALLIVVLIAVGGRLNPETAGAFFAVFAVAAVITGAIAWTRPRRWSIWLYPVLVLAFFAALRLISTLGQTRGR